MQTEEHSGAQLLPLLLEVAPHVGVVVLGHRLPALLLRHLAVEDLGSGVSTPTLQTVVMAGRGVGVAKGVQASSSGGKALVRLQQAGEKVGEAGQEKGRRPEQCQSLEGGHLRDIQSAGGNLRGVHLLLLLITPELLLLLLLQNKSLGLI